MTGTIPELVNRRRARRAMRRWFLALATVVALLLFCVMGIVLALLDRLNDDGSSTYALGCGDNRPVDPAGPMPSMSELTEDQLRIAAVIIKVGQDLKVPPRGWVIAVATALQESRLQNLPNLGPNNDHDSLGVFQQRPSQGWGSPEQLADPAYQARKFYAKLLTIPNWHGLDLTVAAQGVQMSAFPNAYAKHEPLAAKVVDLLTGGASRAAGAEFALRCAGGFDIAASGLDPTRAGSRGLGIPDRRTARA